ncbi:MAG: hypothetical protein AABZ11_05400 [Nitrospinota bacterium]
MANTTYVSNDMQSKGASQMIKGKQSEQANLMKKRQGKTIEKPKNEIIDRNFSKEKTASKMTGKGSRVNKFA